MTYDHGHGNKLREKGKNTTNKGVFSGGKGFRKKEFFPRGPFGPKGHLFPGDENPEKKIRAKGPLEGEPGLGRPPGGFSPRRYQATQRWGEDEKKKGGGLAETGGGGPGPSEPGGPRGGFWGAPPPFFKNPVFGAPRGEGQREKGAFNGGGSRGGVFERGLEPPFWGAPGEGFFPGKPRFRKAPKQGGVWGGEKGGFFPGREVGSEGRLTRDGGPRGGGGPGDGRGALGRRGRGKGPRRRFPPPHWGG